MWNVEIVEKFAVAIFAALSPVCTCAPSMCSQRRLSNGCCVHGDSLSNCFPGIVCYRNDVEVEKAQSESTEKTTEPIKTKTVEEVKAAKEVSVY